MSLNHLEKELMKFFRSYKEVTFIDLKRMFPNHFDKLAGRELRWGEKLLWKELSPEMHDSLKKLLDAKAVEVVEKPARHYSLEGHGLQEKDWMPASLQYRREIMDHAI